jgi:prepilin-type N-terminal cleavage/methylation domain-containing protein
MCTHPRSSSGLSAYLPKAFTLIELLVVISIISLLISILLPALASARKSAVKIKCLANVRGVGQAMLMASQDRKGEIPDLGNYGGANGHFGGQNVTNTDGPYKINQAARNYMLQYGLTRENFYCPNNTAMNTDAYWGPEGNPSLYATTQVVIGYQIIGGRQGFMRKNKADASSSFEAAKQSSIEWYKTSLNPGRESIHLDIEKDAIYDEIVTDIIRTYSDSFSSLSGHMSGPNNTEGRGTYYMDNSANGGTNVMLIDGSGKWRNAQELGMTGSLGDGVCRMRVWGSTKIWW